MTKRFPRARLGLAGILIVAVHGLGAGAVSAQMGPSCQNPIPKKGNPVWVESAKVSAARASLKRVNDSLATNPSNPLAQDAVIRSKGDCEADLAVKNVGLFNGPARMCIAEAATLLGRLGDSSGYDVAVCSYQAAIQLAGNDPAKQVNAWDGLSDLYTRWGNHAGDAERAFAAANTSPTWQRTLGLARVQKDMGKISEADRNYDWITGDDFKNAASMSSNDRISALREQARLRRDNYASLNRDPKGLWGRIAKDDPSPTNKAEAYFEIGRLSFEADPNNLDEATFNLAIDPLNSGRPVDSPHAAKANYYLGVGAARKAVASPAASTPSWTRVAQYSDKAGQGDLRYRQIACLADVALGGKSFEAADDSGSKCPDGPTAEDKLLRGVYLLRRAQISQVSSAYPPCIDVAKGGPNGNACQTARNQAYISNTKLAGKAFDDGQVLVISTPPGPGQGPAVFNWLLKGNGASPNLFGLLKSGQQVTTRFIEATSRGQSSGCPSITRADLTGDQEFAFFSSLDLLSCSAARRGG